MGRYREYIVMVVQSSAKVHVKVLKAITGWGGSTRAHVSPLADVERFRGRGCS